MSTLNQEQLTRSRRKASLVQKKVGAEPANQNHKKTPLVLQKSTLKERWLEGRRIRRWSRRGGSRVGQIRRQLARRTDKVIIASTYNLFSKKTHQHKNSKQKYYLVTVTANP